VGTGLERYTETSADGSYTLPELPIGTYTVTVTQAGFQKFVATGVNVDVASERRVDAAMKAGQVDTQVTVSADQLPIVETTTNDLGGVLTAQTVEDLPVNGRDYTKLIFLNPGVAGSPDQISDSPGSYGEFSMNGARGRSNNYLLDGTDMNDGYRNDPAINQAGVFGTPSAILPIDAVAEVNVISNFLPEFGRNAGAVVNIVSKSGTDQWHGTAGEYFRNDALDARNYFNIASQPKALFHNNQFGASLGGPIVKDKTFFFADYEGQQEGVGVVTLACVPDPAQIAADGGATNSVIAALLARNPWPSPNIPGTYGGSLVGSENSGCPNGPNSSVISPSLNKLTSFIAKIDQNFDPNNILTGRYFFGDSVQSFPLALTASGGQLPGFNTFTPTRVQLVAISYVHTLGANKVNELRYGWNRFAEGFFPQDQGFQPSAIGLETGSGPAGEGMPIITVGSSFAQLGASSSDPRHRFDSNNQLIDNFSWKINKHAVKFGGDFYRTSIQQYFDKYFRGKLEFNGDTIGTPLQDFLAGDVDGGFQYAGDTLRHTHENSYGFFIQDTFRATPHLTLNYGLRYDFFGVIGEKNNLLSNVVLQPATNTSTLVQVRQPGQSSLYNPDRKDFAPRFSLAWDVTGKGKSVVRAGWGMFFDAFSQDMALGHLPYPPYFDPGPAYNPIGPAPIYSAGVTGVIAQGQPLFGNESSCNFECDSFGFVQNIKMPYMENYNLNFQQQINSHSVVQLGYVGSQGHRLWRFFDVSQPSNAQVTAADIANAQSETYPVTVGGVTTNYPCYPGGGPGGTCILSYGVPRNYTNTFGSFYIMQENSTGASNYNSLQASLRITNWNGFTSIVNYVWSKSLDNSSDGEDFEPNAAQPNDSTRPALEYGPSNFNLPQRFTWIFSYKVPNTGGSMQRLKNGWGFDSTVTLQSGQPFQFNYNFEDDFSGSGEGDDRPDIVGPVTYHSNNPADFVDLSSFAIPCSPTQAVTNPLAPGYTGPTGTAQDCIPGTRHFGSEGRDVLHGATYKQWDLAVYKDTSISERLKLQLRADFFNILNHPNFANPFLPAFIADPGINGFGLNSAGTAETGVGGYALTATGDVGIGNPFLGGGAPRGIQLAAKFTF
jgi:hypothetical protein